MKLIQTSNPAVITAIYRWWMKYINRIAERFYEAELNKLISCFKPESENRLYILTDGKTISGYAVITLDSLTNTLMVLQVSTDNVKMMKEEIEKIADKTGAVSIMFYTERNPAAWQRLTGAKPVGTVMEV